MRLRLPALAIGCAVSAFAVGALSGAEWEVSGELGVHDPTVLKQGDDWWCFATGRGLRVKHSVDGRHWEQRPPLFTEPLAWWKTYAPAMRELDLWAPDLAEFGGRVWCFYTVSEFGRNNSAIGLKSCSSIAAGDWRDDGFVLGSRQGVDAYNAIDPNLTVDGEGKPWLTFGSWFDGIQLVALDPTTMKPTGPMVPLARRQGGIEAPIIIRAHERYYLFISVDRCCQGVNSTYRIAVGRSDKIDGPYLDRAGVRLLDGGFSVIEAGGERWKGPGGQHVFRQADGWAIARHAYDAAQAGRPTLRVADLTWDDEQWPRLAP